MILSDRSIREYCGEMKLIRPFRQDQLQPASYDLTLLDQLIMPTGEKISFEQHRLWPRQFVLASTVEVITLPPNMVGHIRGKSGHRRKGFVVCCDAGFCDPGWSGQATLELYNHHPTEPFILTAGMRIGQIIFEWLDSPAERPYGHPDLGSHFQNQRGVTKSAY